MYKLPQLPYSFDALEPFIDAKTMEVHYTKHHQGYLDKLNTALELKPEFFEKPIEELIKNINSLPEEIKLPVRNAGGGYFNHNIFWENLTGEKTEPQEKTLGLINDSFENFEKFKEEFTAKSLSLFGSGWVWLALNNDKLEIIQTPNQDNPITNSDIKILLASDLWEHAYYLKYQNRRNEYVESFWNVINWNIVEARLNKI